MLSFYDFGGEVTTFFSFRRPFRRFFIVRGGTRYPGEEKLTLGAD